MATVEGFDFPDELYYTKEHVWAKVDGNIVTIGLTQLGQDLAGDILYVEMPAEGRDIAQEEAFMSMESGKWVGRVKAPVSGTILESNTELEWESDLVNSDPYDTGWLTKLEASDLSELDTLFRADSPDLLAFVIEEKKKFKK
jgi:glycine cleavage system H protein